MPILVNSLFLTRNQVQLNQVIMQKLFDNNWLSTVIIVIVQPIHKDSISFNILLFQKSKKYGKFFFFNVCHCRNDDGAYVTTMAQYPNPNTFMTNSGILTNNPFLIEY